MPFQSLRQEYIPASPVLRLHSIRTYGEPKIKRPSELKGLKAEATFAVRGKHAKGGLFLKDGKAWWLCRDFASKDATFPEAKDMELPTLCAVKEIRLAERKFQNIYLSRCLVPHIAEKRSMDRVRQRSHSANEYLANKPRSVGLHFKEHRPAGMLGRFRQPRKGIDGHLPLDMEERK